MAIPEPASAGFSGVSQGFQPLGAAFLFGFSAKSAGAPTAGRPLHQSARIMNVRRRSSSGRKRPVSMTDQM
jgi:hypothetical protein